MEKIEIYDIDFSGLHKLNRQGTNSTIYKDERTCYKLLTGLYEDDKDLLYKKFMEMDGLKLNNIILPQGLIMQDGRLQGYTMEYFENSISLFEKFMTRYVDSELLFGDLFRASKILRKLHEAGIICCDLNFDNILVNKSGKIMFCGIDGCSYGNYNGFFVSTLMKKFWLDYRKEELMLTNNIDRVSMFISFYHLIFLKGLQEITVKEYNWLANRINTLNNMRECTISLMNREKPIGDVPYLDELINLDDKYVIDHQKQSRLVRRLLNK